MNKSTLLTIADILNNLDYHNRELMEMLELINLTPEEYDRVFDSINVLAEKITNIKQSRIEDLNEHVDINYIENMYRY